MTPARGYSPPALSERTDAELSETLAFFEGRARRWDEYAERLSDPAGLMRAEADRWASRAKAVRDEIACRSVEWVKQHSRGDASGPRAHASHRAPTGLGHPVSPAIARKDAA